MKVAFSKAVVLGLPIGTHTDTKVIEANPSGCTLDVIAEALGVTRMRAKQIVDGAIKKVIYHLSHRGIRHLDDIAPRSHYSHRTTDSLFG